MVKVANVWRGKAGIPYLLMVSQNQGKHRLLGMELLFTKFQQIVIINFAQCRELAISMIPY